jgi:hypothetical protein
MLFLEPVIKKITKGSSGLASVNNELIERRTNLFLLPFYIVRAGLH